MPAKQGEVIAATYFNTDAEYERAIWPHVKNALDTAAEVNAYIGGENGDEQLTKWCDSLTLAAIDELGYDARESFGSYGVQTIVQVVIRTLREADKRSVEE